MSSSSRAVAPSLNGWNAEYLQAEYDRFRADPASVSPDLRAFFHGFDLGLNPSAGTLVAAAKPGAGAGDAFSRSVEDLVYAYREMGHLAAQLDPLGRSRTRPPALSLAAHGLSEKDFSRTVTTDAMPGKATATLGELVAHLERVYCGSFAVEFMHVPDETQRAWFRSRIEHGVGVPPLSDEQKTTVLDQLTTAEVFDRFLGKRYQGKKRFSIEGGESLIPFLKWTAQRAGELGVEELILGMAHRGRLSVLKNFLGKAPEQLFTEFEDAWADGENQSGGDVKYHRGYSGDQRIDAQRSIHLSMLNNPSHLESVNPVVMGKTRAKQDIIGDAERRRVVSLLIHGDAAVAGQGVVAECLTMSQLQGYTVGGTIHVVANNQVGFTTDPEDARSTVYCTDVAKMINAPVLHVNGDDPEAVVIAARLAAEYRHEFRRDIFVDIVCFRRFGHNEQDEPSYTQPTLYALIKNHPGTAEVYRRKLIEAGVVTADKANELVDREMKLLEQGQTAAQSKPVNPVPAPGGGQWKGFQHKYCFETPNTAVAPAVIAEVCRALGTAPADFNVHPKLKALLQARAGLPQSKKLSHADAELIAVGTLLLDGVSARLSGQDARRGTFTQRHAVLRDEQTGVRYTPLNHIRPGQLASYSVWDSPLSEYGVMGFDYGYSRAAPRSLVMWEGQFGDFVNGAQIMLDQYLASSEAKWSRWAGLVLLLPHGYEGQGPEHSSARLERFLQMCANDNMEVIYPSTGAQIFHALRRQAMRDFRKPLIVMTPKKYLRFESSSIDELSSGVFNHLIDDATIAGGASKSVDRVIYCSGKLYHELHERRVQSGKQNIAIVRIEQLYPFHAARAKEIDGKYPRSAQRVWVQEEPRNQGAYIYIADAFRQSLGVELGYIGRPASASPATGSEHAHKHQQELILSEAIAPMKKDAASSGGAKPAAPEPKPAAAPARAAQPAKAKR